MNAEPKFLNDKRIISAILAGNKELFRELYHTYKRQLMLTCLRYIADRNTAEDILQESFIAIYKDLSKFDETRGTFITWATRITINQCLKKLRKKSVFSNMDSLMEIKYKWSVRSTAVERLNLEDLTKVISAMPNGYKTVFNMYVIDGFTHKEIARQLGISESTSKTQLMRAKRLLKTTIKEEDYKLLESYA